MTESEHANNQVCESCKTENSPTALFCHNCALPLNEKGRKKKLGYRPVLWSFFVPGLGQYRQGRRKPGLVIMGLFFICFIMYALTSAQVAVKTVNTALMSGAGLSADSISESLKNSKGIMVDVYSWGYIIAWVFAVADAFYFVKKSS
jgi:ribosomal protein L40E